MADYQLFINGGYRDAASGETFATHNPATGEKIADVAKAGKEDAVAAITAARKAFDEGPWPRTTRHGARREAATRSPSCIGAKAAEVRRDRGARRRRHDPKAQFADVPGAHRARSSGSPSMAEEQPETVDLPGSPFPPSENYIKYEPHRRVHRASSRGTSR